MPNTGYKAYTNLEQYFLDNGVATGITKPNNVSDPDYVAPVYDTVFCPLPSVSPSVTPTVSVTPSITPTISVTPSITPTVTPTVTPTISVSTSVPATPSITPTISVTPTITVTPTPTPSSGFKPTVIGFGAFNQACIGGTCDEYMGWNLYLDAPAPSNVNYSLQVTMRYSSGGGFAYYETVYGTILTGDTNDLYNNDPCLGGGTYIGCTVYPDTSCILYIDTAIVNNPYGVC